MNNKKCQLCENYKDGYCEELELKPCYPEKGCDYFSRPLEQEPCEDAVSRQAVLDAIDVKAWEFCDYLISKNRNDEQKPVSHFADNLRECVREELPPVNPQNCDKCEVGNPCLYCRHEFESQERSDKE